MTKTKQENKAVRYFFLISLTLHTIFLFYLGRSFFTKRYNRRIEVDLKFLASEKPIRSIPTPYRRLKASPETKRIKTPIKSLVSKPVLAHAPVKPASPERAFSPEAVEKVHVPVNEFHTSAGEGIIGQIKGVAIPDVPTRIKIAHDTFDHTLAYQGIIRRHLEEHKQFPPLAVKRGLEGRVGIRFLLHHNGQVEQVEVIKSSGISILDKAAINAVHDGIPFPPFPESISEDFLAIEVALNFELRRGVP